MLRSIKKYSILVLIAVFVLTSCIDKNRRKNNYPTPNINFELPVGDVYTIDTLLYMWHAEGTHTFTQDASVYGIVTDDEASGNLYKASFIQDGDKAIELYMKSTSGLRIGDSVRVYLKGATLSEYSGTPQIQDLEPTNVTILANNKFIDPVEISTTEINSSYVCRLVKFNHVEFKPDDRANTYAPDDAYGQFNLAQCDDNCNYIDESVVVRTSNYASFAKRQLPQGNGSIIGILTQYTGSGNPVWQFTIRTISEVQMDNDPCQATPEPPVQPTGSGTENDPYNIAGGVAYQGTDGQWIRGYIVGSANLPYNGTIMYDSDIAWGPEFTNEYNILSIILADDANERDINKCVVVYLPSNTASGIRSINLKDHPENLGKVLKVHGNLKAYLGKSGMKDTNEYTLN